MNDNKQNTDVVVTSRVRIARNLSDFPFPSAMTVEDSCNVIAKITEKVFNEISGLKEEFVYINLSDLNETDKYYLLEKHLISPIMVGNNLKRGVLVNKKENISILINEEDHIRIQCLNFGEKLETSYEEASRIDKLIEERLNIAYDDKYGFLTCCPTNVGTGLRLSCMLHLPALVITKHINSILTSLSKLSIAVRGIYGEGSEAKGNLFQVSNQVTLGVTEAETISNLKNIVNQIVTKERQLRQRVLENNKTIIEDKLYRSYGVLTNARILTSEETINLLSDLRLAVELDLIKNIPLDAIDQMFISSQPANIIKKYGLNLTDEERDVKRAEFIRKKVEEYV